MFSASSETRDRNAPTNANQIRLQTSRIGQQHRPIRYQLPARLSFRQGQAGEPLPYNLGGLMRGGKAKTFAASIPSDQAARAIRMLEVRSVSALPAKAQSA